MLCVVVLQYLLVHLPPCRSRWKDGRKDEEDSMDGWTDGESDAECHGDVASTCWCISTPCVVVRRAGSVVVL